MRLAKNELNTGFVQGIIKTPPRFLKEKLAVVKIQVKDEKADPITMTRNRFLLSFLAFDSMAEKLAKASVGDIIYVRYHLIRTLKKNKDGKKVIQKNSIIDEIIIGEHLTGDDIVYVPYVNQGLFQGELVNMLNDEKEKKAHLIVKTVLPGYQGKGFYDLLDFTAYGPLANSIVSKYTIGNSVVLRYKMESEQKNGTIETNYVITSY